MCSNSLEVILPQKLRSYTEHVSYIRTLHTGCSQNLHQGSRGSTCENSLPGATGDQSKLQAITLIFQEVWRVSMHLHLIQAACESSLAHSTDSPVMSGRRPGTNLTIGFDSTNRTCTGDTEAIPFLREQLLAAVTSEHAAAEDLTWL